MMGQNLATSNPPLSTLVQSITSLGDVRNILDFIS